MFHFLQLCICNHMQRLRKSHSCAARKDTLCFWGETTQSGCEFWSGCSWSTSNSGSSASCTGSFSSCASPFAKTLLPFFLREARWQLENSPKKHTSEIKRSSLMNFSARVGASSGQTTESNCNMWAGCSWGTSSGSGSTGGTGRLVCDVCDVFF